MSRILIYFLTIWLALVQLATANFDLYKIWTWVPEGGRYGTTINDLWLITESHSDRCADIDRYSIWASKEDLSHNRLGVRCWGSCNFGDYPWPNIKLVEMNFSNKPLHHFTIYKNKGRLVGDTWRWTLFGTDDKSYGECFAYGDDGFKCDWPSDKLHIEGARKFRCLTLFNAYTINWAHKVEIGGPIHNVGNITTVPSEG